MDWKAVRAERSEKAAKLLEEAERLVFEAGLNLSGIGLEPSANGACEKAYSALIDAKEMLKCVALAKQPC